MIQVLQVFGSDGGGGKEREGRGGIIGEREREERRGEKEELSE